MWSHIQIRAAKSLQFCAGDLSDLSFVYVLDLGVADQGSGIKMAFSCYVTGYLSIIISPSDEVCNIDAEINRGSAGCLSF